MGSYLQARSLRGEWLVRIEDIDPPREMPGAADAILYSLERLGLEWDGAVVYQSHRSEAYLAAIDTLCRNGRLYACRCSRKDLIARHPPDAPPFVYDGHCRRIKPDPTHPAVLRLITEGTPVTFDDRVRGPVVQSLATEVGDFIIRRTGGLFAYQLAVVIDDAAQGITEIVRGADLLDNTPRQIYLQALLGLPTPHYAHLPVAVNPQGQKLSKQTGAASIDHLRPQQLIIQALEFLGQQPPAELVDTTLDELWRWAIASWRLDRVPRDDRGAPAIDK